MSNNTWRDQILTVFDAQEAEHEATKQRLLHTNSVLKAAKATLSDLLALDLDDDQQVAVQQKQAAVKQAGADLRKQAVAHNAGETVDKTMLDKIESVAGEALSLSTRLTTVEQKVEEHDDLLTQIKTNLGLTEEGKSDLDTVKEALKTVSTHAGVTSKRVDNVETATQAEFQKIGTWSRTVDDRLAAVTKSRQSDRKVNLYGLGSGVGVWLLVTLICLMASAGWQGYVIAAVLGLVAGGIVLTFGGNFISKKPKSNGNRAAASQAVVQPVVPQPQQELGDTKESKPVAAKPRNQTGKNRSGQLEAA
jgi:hypothetical protein